MKETVSLRHAVEADLPQILEIYNEVILNTTAVYDYEPHTPDMRYKWFTDRRRDGMPVIVTTNGKEITGFGSFGLFRPWQAYRFTVEHSLYVKNDYRGKGIAKLLLPALIDIAREMGKHTMIAGIDAENIASIKLHAQFGFEKVAHMKQVGFKFDRWLDLVFYQLMLD
jgi:phosphinothricin acetyltransferase